jgi:hypothetical protein
MIFSAFISGKNLLSGVKSVLSLTFSVNVAGFIVMTAIFSINISPLPLKSILPNKIFEKIYNRINYFK